MFHNVYITVPYNRHHQKTHFSLFWKRNRGTFKKHIYFININIYIFIKHSGGGGIWPERSIEK